MSDPKKPFECVLPISGKFASIGPIKLMDVLIATSAQSLALALLASRVAKIDDQPLTFQQWCEWDFDDVAPVMSELNRRYLAGMQNKGVA